MNTLTITHSREIQLYILNCDVPRNKIQNHWKSIFFSIETSLTTTKLKASIKIKKSQVYVTL